MPTFVLALLLIGIGLSVAGTGTHLYQQVVRKVAGLRVEGRNAVEHLGSLTVLFFCGPYLMLRMGFETDASGRHSSVNILLTAIIAFGWSFLTGLMIVGTYVAMIRASA